MHLKCAIPPNAGQAATEADQGTNARTTKINKTLPTRQSSHISSLAFSLRGTEGASTYCNSALP